MTGALKRQPGLSVEIKHGVCFVWQVRPSSYRRQFRPYVWSCNQPLGHDRAYFPHYPNIHRHALANPGSVTAEGETHKNLTPAKLYKSFSDIGLDLAGPDNSGPLGFAACCFETRTLPPQSGPSLHVNTIQRLNQHVESHCQCSRNVRTQLATYLKDAN